MEYASKKEMPNRDMVAGLPLYQLTAGVSLYMEFSAFLL